MRTPRDDHHPDVGTITVRSIHLHFDDEPPSMLGAIRFRNPERTLGASRIDVQSTDEAPGITLTLTALAHAGRPAAATCRIEPHTATPGTGGTCSSPKRAD